MKILMMVPVLLLLTACTVKTTQVREKVDLVNTPIPEGSTRIKLSREYKLVSFHANLRIKDNGVKVGVLNIDGTIVYDRPAGRACIEAIDPRRGLVDYLCVDAPSGKVVNMQFDGDDGLSVDDFSLVVSPGRVMDPR